VEASFGATVVSAAAGSEAGATEAAPGFAVCNEDAVAMVASVEVVGVEGAAAALTDAVTSLAGCSLAAVAPSRASVVVARASTVIGGGACGPADADGALACDPAIAFRGVCGITLATTWLTLGNCGTLTWAVTNVVTLCHNEDGSPATALGVPWLPDGATSRANVGSLGGAT
jgi:hypothetical protein